MKLLVTPFRIVLCFFAIALIGCFVLSKLKVDLRPQEKSSSLYISFSMPNSSPEIVEQYLTSIIENACSRIQLLKKISSVSNYGGGSVELRFDNSADMPYKQLETAAIIRQLYAQLPASATYPIITPAGNSQQQDPLLVYSIHAQFQSYFIGQKAESIFHEAFAAIDGIREVRVSGVKKPQLVIQFDIDKCNAWRLSPKQLFAHLTSSSSPSYLGSIVSASGTQFFLQLSAANLTIETIENTFVGTSDHHPIKLKEIAAAYIAEPAAQDYFRINGRNSVSMKIYVKQGENKILLGEKIKQAVSRVQRGLPEGFSVNLEVDNALPLRNEINKNRQRIGISLFILAIFIMIAYRSWRYIANLFFGLLISLLLTMIFSWIFKLSIHLYTIGGFAISFGIMIDNAIVMLDHFHNKRDRKIFLPVLAGSLVILAALSLVFFLPEEEKLNLTDFALAVIFSLLSSLVTALLFTPGLYVLLKNSHEGKVISHTSNLRASLQKWETRVFTIYYSVISFLARFRKSFVILLILGFGLPVFLLPTKWEGDSWYNKLYNDTLGSEHYQKNIRSSVEKVLGGAMRLFVKDVFEQGGHYRSTDETKLYIIAGLPYGHTPEQMDFIIRDFEKYLFAINGIDKFISTIYDGQRGEIEIRFKKSVANSFPFQLKAQLVSRSLNWGGIEWKIYGVGQAFNNLNNENSPNFNIVLKGYNYDELEKQADHLSTKLIKHPRIQKVNANDNLDFDEKQNAEYVLDLNALQMAAQNTHQYEILEKLGEVSLPENPTVQVASANEFLPLVVKEMKSENFSKLDLLRGNIMLDSSRIVRIENFGKFIFRNTASSIHKEDRQYIRVVSFNYMGSGYFANKYLSEVLKETNDEMPPGYSAIKKGWNWDMEGSRRQYGLIFLLLLTIYFICSVLFENLRTPFFIISMVPISFIGLFLIFSLGHYYFDQGGYAAFIMLGGLVTNAAIFIVNDFNQLRKSENSQSYNLALMKAVTKRAKTILLTTASTSCGLLPFLLEGQEEVFWFAFSIGTIGGLLFSLFSLFVVLPVFLWRKKF
jgi:multidrug efflux pump subunit AcrB